METTQFNKIQTFFKHKSITSFQILLTHCSNHFPSSQLFFFSLHISRQINGTGSKTTKAAKFHTLDFFTNGHAIILSDKMIHIFSSIFSSENIALFGFQESLDRSHGSREGKGKERISLQGREKPLFLSCYGFKAFNAACGVWQIWLKAKIVNFYPFLVGTCCCER